MAEFDRIQRNVKKMIDQQAPVQDIDGYLATEGYTPEKFKARVGAAGDTFMTGLNKTLQQGVTLSGSDEIRGVAAGTANVLKRVIPGGSEGGTFKEGYERGVEQERASLSKFREEHPVIAGTTGFFGSLGTGGPVGAGAAGSIAAKVLPPATSVPSLTSQVIKGGATGATYGATSGFASGEGGLTNRLEGAKTGAATGAAVGAAVPLAFHIGGKVVQWRRGNKPPDAIGERILRALSDDGLTPADAAAKYKGWLDDGAKPEALFELGGQNTRDLLNQAVNVPGPQREQGRQFLEARQEGTGNRIISDAKAGISGGDYRGTVDDLITQRKTAAKPLYDSAYRAGEAGVWSDTLEDLIQRPTMAAAWREAAKDAADEGDRLPEIFKLNDKGEIVGSTEVPSLKAWDYIKRGLDNIIRDNTDEITGKVSSEGARAQKLKQALLAELDDTIPEYAQARAAFAGPSQSLDAVKLGRDLFTGRLEDMQAKVARLPASEREMFKVGVMEAIRDRVGSKGDMTNIAQALRGTPNLRERLMLAFEDSTEAEKFMRLLGRERDMTSNFQKALHGSPTSPRERGSADMLLELGMDAATGGKAGIVRKLVRAVAGQQPTRLDPATGNQLAAALLQADPMANLHQLKTLQGQFNTAQSMNRYVGLANALIGRPGAATAGRERGAR
jgi:hypothetical protein